MSDPNLNTTAPAEPNIGNTPPPVDESWESQISRQLKSKPKIERTDLKSLENLPDMTVPVPDGMDEVSTQESEDFLKQMEGGSTDTKAESKKEVKAEETKPENSFDISDIDLSKDPEPVVEKKKKSKEDNIAELRKKAESYEETLKSKDTEVQTYREKLEKLEAELERTAFERSPKFKEKYETPYKASIEQASQFAQEIAEDATIAEKALSLKGKERIEFIDESFGGGAASAQFLQLINDADGKRGALEGALADYRNTAVKIQEAEVQSQVETSETINKNFDRMKAHLANKSEFFREVEGDDDHNRAVSARVEAARAIIHGNASQNEMVVAPFLAVIAKEAVAENEKLKAELARYKSRAAADAAVQPRITKGSSSDDEGESRGKPKSALDSIRSQLRSY